MKINIAQRNSCLEFIQQMTYSRCEADYNATYSEFCASAPQPVKDYFNKNWHPIREEWVMAFKSSVPNFQNSTNNRLESLNGKLKSVINLYSSMEEFIKHFFIILNCLRDVRSDAVAYSYQKEPVLPFAANFPESAYLNLLTPYSAMFFNRWKYAMSTRFIGLMKALELINCRRRMVLSR